MPQLTLAEKAREQIDMFLKSKKALEDEANARGSSVADSVIDKIAYEIARSSFEEEHKTNTMKPNLNQFTKFDGTQNPSTYLDMFVD